MKSLHQAWSRSKPFRIILVITLVYVLLRLLVQMAYIVVMTSPNLLPDWASETEAEVPVDLQVYLDAAANFKLKKDVYLKDSLDRIEYHFPYPPSFAMVFVPFLWLSPLAVTIVHTLVHIVVYVAMYLRWGRIFRKLGLGRAEEMLAWTLPVWLIFGAFWADLGYLNIYTIMAFLATLLIDALLSEHLGWALIWLSIILQTKPMWAFAVAVPLLRGRYRFLAKLLGSTALVYLAVMGATILIAGPSYGWQQYEDYFGLLSRLGSDFPWRGPDAPFLGYNHSIKQIMVYMLGPMPIVLRVATGVKALFLVPLILVGLRYLVRPSRLAGCDAPELALDMAFVSYLGAFIWLDIVWELTLGIAVFTYLLATSQWERTRNLTWVVFLPYALVDFFQVAGLSVLGWDAILPGPYLITDPSIYVPLIMVVILAFYVLLIRRLWVSSARQAEGQCSGP